MLKSHEELSEKSPIKPEEAEEILPQIGRLRSNTASGKDSSRRLNLGQNSPASTKGFQTSTDGQSITLQIPNSSHTTLSEMSKGKSKTHLDEIDTIEEVPTPKENSPAKSKFLFFQESQQPAVSSNECI